MKDSTFVTSLLALKCWQDGRDEGLNGMLGIAFTIRNRIRASWYGGSWVDVLAHHKEWSATLESPGDALPDPRVYSFTVFLQQVDQIFSGALDDFITIKKDGEWRTVLSAAPPVALYYGYLNNISNPWFRENISLKGEQHPRIATVGGLTFFA